MQSRELEAQTVSASGVHWKYVRGHGEFQRAGWICAEHCKTWKVCQFGIERSIKQHREMTSQTGMENFIMEGG